MSGVEQLLAAGLFVGLLVGVAVVLGRSLTDIVVVSMLSFGLFYGFRAVLLATGLDTPSPDDLFTDGEWQQSLTRTLLAASAFVAALGLGVHATTRPGSRGFAPFLVRRDVHAGRLLQVVVLLTVGSVVLSVALIGIFGGVGALITAAKLDKALAGFYVLRIIPAVGSVVSTAGFLDLRRRNPLAAVACLTCAAVNSAAVFLWGSRSLAVITVAFIGLGLVQGARGRGAGRRVVVGLLVSAVLVVTVAGVLRSTRDTLTRGEVQDSYADASWARQASLGANAVYLDAAVLAFRDFPERWPLRDGEDFVNGVAGLVPRTVWPGKPTGIAPGSWFRQVYEPRVVNGWPMGAPALWYLNFGWLGVPLGGLVSGLAIGVIAAAQRRRPQNGFNSVAAVTAGVFVLGLGVDSQTLVYTAVWLVPLWLIARYVEDTGQDERTMPSAASGEKPGNSDDTGTSNRRETISQSTLR